MAVDIRNERASVNLFGLPTLSKSVRFSRLAVLRVTWLLVTILATFGVILAPNPLTTPSIVSAPLRSIRGTDVNPLGATFFLDREVELWKREQTVKMARDAGLGWAKIMFAWHDIEPREGRYYDDRYRKSTWEKFDEIVGVTEKYGIRIIARLDKPPDWALAAPGATGDGGTPLRSVREYASYAGQVAARYRGRIQHYQIWNEPNLAAEWYGRSPDPVAYSALLKATAASIRENDPDAVILSGPLAQTLERSERAMPETDFLEGMYRAGAGPAFDILFANAYGFERPPSDPPRADVLNFQRVRLLRDTMVQQGDRTKPVWLNELGWNAAPASFPEQRLLWGRVSEEKQAEFTADALRLARSWDWIGVVNLWFFRQVGDMSPSDRAEYYFRVVDVDFTPRLVYYAIKDYSATLRAAPPGLHQETSPGVDLKGSWRHRSAGVLGDDFVLTEQVGDTLTFNFVGSSLVIGAVKGPNGGVLQVKIDGAEVSSLPRDAAGRTTIDLSAAATAIEPVSVATGLGAGRHSVQFTVLGGRVPGSTVGIAWLEVGGIEVTYWPFFGQAALAVVGLLGLARSFLRRRLGD